MEARPKISLVQCMNREPKVANVKALFATLYRSGYNIQWETGEDSDIGRSRSYQASRFLDDPGRGEVLVFIDDDILWDVGGFQRLVELCRETEELSSGIYVVRDTQFPHIASALFPGQKLTVGEGEPEPIKYAATGFFAMHRKALQRIWDEYPWGHDIPVQSGPRFMAPFFLEMVHDDQYLSEDFAFCQRAAELDIKTWVDPQIRLSHIGERAYSITDLEANAFRREVTLTVDEGGPDPTNILKHLSEYLDVPRAEMWQRLREYEVRVRLADEWKENIPENVAETHQYYQEAEDYLMELSRFNLDVRYNVRVFPTNNLDGKVLDFGGGIGTLSLMLADRGVDVTYVELASKHREFAEWRFIKRGKSIPCYADMSNLPDGSFDSVVAMDVLEHIHPDEIEDLMAEFNRVLSPGGRLVQVSPFGEVGDHGECPEHYDTAAEWVEALERHGFTDVNKFTWIKPAGEPVGV